MEAVRELRTRLGDTQQAFAARTGLAISTVVRYELSRPPKGQALAMFERLAFASSHGDLAAVFRRQALLDAGLTLPVGNPPLESRNTLAVPVGYDTALLAFIDVLSVPRFAKERTKILALLKDRIAIYEKAMGTFLKRGASDEG
jgi:transcriptional regulator with XRE-family HTH domain